MTRERSHRMKRLRLFLSCQSIVFILWLICFLPPSALSEEGKGLAGFQAKVSKLIQSPRWDSTFWGIHIVSLDTGKTLYSANGQKRFLPASNMKILTCAAILDGMDPSERITTPVYATGRIDKWGRILGDIVLLGRGDPNLEKREYDIEHEVFENNALPASITTLADQLQLRGIKAVEGNIIADETYFLHQPFGPGWTIEDSAWGYGAPISALAVNENMITVRISPGEKPNDVAQMQTFPSVTNPGTVINAVKTVPGDGETAIQLIHSLEKGTHSFAGAISLSHTKMDYQIAVSDPANFAGSLLRLALLQRGIHVRGEVKTRIRETVESSAKKDILREKGSAVEHSPPEGIQVASIQGLPIFESLKIMMKESQNLYAECLLRLLGARTLGVGSTETGLQALKQFLNKAGCSNLNLRLRDASGISRKNLVTPESIVRILAYMYQSPQRENFLNTFPVAGKDGTLKPRFQKTPAAGRILAKTGTLESVSTLSGYAETKEGAHLAFSLMVNNDAERPDDIRESLDQLCLWIVDLAAME